MGSDRAPSSGFSHSTRLSERVEFVQPLRTELWGARTFIVRDSDGRSPFCSPGAVNRHRTISMLTVPRGRTITRRTRSLVA